MTGYWQDSARTLYNHDCRTMAELPNNSVQLCVTSPPYWGLRAYKGNQDLIWGGDNHHEHVWVETTKQASSGSLLPMPQVLGGSQTQIISATHQKQVSNFCQVCGAWRGAFGLEPTVELYIQHSIEILREIKRVLRPDGVVFWNIGDSYSGSMKGAGDNGKAYAGAKQRTVRGSAGLPVMECGELKPKDLCLIPERFALAAQADGWWVRSRICWNKPNPMPESVQDRPTDSWEHIWMLTKSARYFYDSEAVREPQTGNAHSRGTEACNKAYQEARGSYKGFNTPAVEVPGGRNLRSVWTFPTQSFRGAHFATFPKTLPELCIKAATSEKGCCPKCGKPWARIVEKAECPHDGVTAAKEESNTHRISLMRQAARERGEEYHTDVKTLGWKPTCD